MGCLVFLAALSLSFEAAHADRILSRHSKLDFILFYFLKILLVKLENLQTHSEKETARETNL